MKIAENILDKFLAQIEDFSDRFLFFVTVYIRQVECKVRVSLEEIYFHHKRLEGVELIHEIIDCFCEPQSYITLLKVANYGILVSNSIWMHHNMVGEEHLSPLNEFSEC